MTRVVLRYLLQAALTLAPFWAGLLAKKLSWSEPGDIVVRTLVAFGILLISFVYDAADYAAPALRAHELGKKFVARIEKAVQPKAEGVSMGADIRVDVLVLGSPLPLLRLPLVFKWFANPGFGGGHVDNGMRLWRWQGLSGLAMSKRKAMFVESAGLAAIAAPAGPFSKEALYLTRRQCETTSHLRAILSVPMLREGQKKGSLVKRWKAVGVINVDAVSANGETWLVANRERLEKRTCSKRGPYLRTSSVDKLAKTPIFIHQGSPTMSHDIPSFVKVGAGEPARSKAEIVENPPVFAEVPVTLSSGDASSRPVVRPSEPARQPRVSATG